MLSRASSKPHTDACLTPLTTSSYLDRTKDSSLAVAIGHQDLVGTVNTTGQSLEALMILVFTYLGISVIVSA